MYHDFYSLYRYGHTEHVGIQLDVRSLLNLREGRRIANFQIKRRNNMLNNYFFFQVFYTPLIYN